MIRLAPTITALVAITIAGICALADGALLASDAQAGSGFSDRERTHRALAFARIVAHLTAGGAIGAMLHLAERPGFARVLLAIAAAALVAGLVEGTARSVGDAGGATLGRRLSAVVRMIDAVLAPVTLAAARLDSWMLKVAPPPAPDAQDDDVTSEQFRQVVAAEAVGTGEQEAILQGVFSLGELEVGEVMIPRVSIVAIDRETHWSEVVDRVRASEHARFPVFAETVDDIIGILYAKDLLPAIVADEEPPEGWPTLVRPAAFIPATKTLDEQLRDFKASHSHIAIVVDEYGGTAGLVTIEDILEQIVGDIRDEYDVEEPDVISEDGCRFWVAGRLPLAELSELLDHDFSNEEVATAGGLVYTHLGRVPRSGEELTIAGFRVVVERVRRRRIERIYFSRPPRTIERRSA